jgi:hypothetical protein
MLVNDGEEDVGGDGGIRTLDRTLQPYNGLANRRLQPLGHVSTQATGTLCLQSNMRFEICPSKDALARPPKQHVVPRPPLPSYG